MLALSVIAAPQYQHQDVKDDSCSMEWIIVYTDDLPASSIVGEQLAISTSSGSQCGSPTMAATSVSAADGKTNYDNTAQYKVMSNDRYDLFKSRWSCISFVYATRNF